METWERGTNVTQPRQYFGKGGARRPVKPSNARPDPVEFVARKVINLKNKEKGHGKHFCKLAFPKFVCAHTEEYIVFP